jgi:hypothetical protein
LERLGCMEQHPHGIRPRESLLVQSAQSMMEVGREPGLAQFRFPLAGLTGFEECRHTERGSWGQPGPLKRTNYSSPTLDSCGSG